MDIPKVSELEQNNMGYVVKGEHIVGLSLSSSDISYIAESIEYLSSLKVLNLSECKSLKKNFYS